MVMDDEHRELLAGFLVESRELLDEVEPELIRLEQDARTGSVQGETLDKVFRLFHSLKGGAGMLNLAVIQQVTHKAESILSLYRKGLAHPNTGHIDLLNKTLDFVRHLLDKVEEQGNDLGQEEEAGELGDLLGRLLRCLESGGTGLENCEAELARLHKPDPAQPEPAPSPEAVVAPAQDFNLLITDGLVQQFLAESQELLAIAEESILRLEKSPLDSDLLDTAFRAFHSFKGNCGIMGFADLQRLSHQVESVLDRVRVQHLVMNSGMHSLLLSCFDFIRKAMARLADSKDPSIPALNGLLSMLKDAAESYDAPRSQADLDDLVVPPPVPSIVMTARRPEAPAVAEEAGPQAEAPTPATVSMPAPVAEAQPGTPREERPAPAPAGAPRSDEAPKGGLAGGTRQSIRVDVDKLDHLLDLVGELVIAQTMVAQNPDLQAPGLSLDRFERSVRQLEKITRNLQDVSTSIRMTTLSGLFRRMPRLVRDLAVRTGKQVELAMAGEETEVDLTLIEKITDPLVHIIRNSVDHGLEPPDERRAAGKPPQGTVRLSARVVGSEVWILVEDDGRGLDRSRILAKARERGLVEGDGSQLADEQVWALIFEAGFSTAQQVTDVSGRGVGMDVVRRNIESISGRVDIRSKAGEGSTVILRIPLTLAITDGMILRVGASRYIMPVIHIRESLQPDVGTITRTMDGTEILRIRGELLPVLRLHELFGVPSQHTALEEGIVLVLENEGRTLCLFVDEIVGQQQIVVKGLSRYLGAIAGVSGCTILGNGEISLILDIHGIFDHAHGAAGEASHTARSLRAESPPLSSEAQ
jgi:two-component system chemotaxis sensor kinase CheA